MREISVGPRDEAAPGARRSACPASAWITLAVHSTPSARRSWLRSMTARSARPTSRWISWTGARAASSALASGCSSNGEHRVLGGNPPSPAPWKGERGASTDAVQMTFVAPNSTSTSLGCRRKSRVTVVGGADPGRARRAAASLAAVREVLLTNHAPPGAAAGAGVGGDGIRSRPRIADRCAGWGPAHPSSERRGRVVPCPLTAPARAPCLRRDLDMSSGTGPSVPRHRRRAPAPARGPGSQARACNSPDPAGSRGRSRPGTFVSLRRRSSRGFGGRSRSAIRIAASPRRRGRRTPPASLPRLEMRRDCVIELWTTTSARPRGLHLELRWARDPRGSAPRGQGDAASARTAVVQLRAPSGRALRRWP